MKNKFTDKEIEKFVLELVETNEVIWTAMCHCENLLDQDVYKYFKNNDEDEDYYNELMSKIAKSFDEITTLKSSDSEFAKPEVNELDFANFEQLGKDINKYRNK